MTQKVETAAEFDSRTALLGFETTQPNSNSFQRYCGYICLDITSGLLSMSVLIKKTKVCCGFRGLQDNDSQPCGVPKVEFKTALQISQYFKFVRSGPRHVMVAVLNTSYMVNRIKIYKPNQTLKL